MDVKDEIAEILESYRRFGDYPKEVLADKILSLPIGVGVECLGTSYMKSYGYNNCKKLYKDCGGCKGIGKLSPTIQTAIDEYKKNHGEGK